jgi:hypothetical protein
MRVTTAAHAAAMAAIVQCDSIESQHWMVLSDAVKQKTKPAVCLLALNYGLCYILKCS